MKPQPTPAPEPKPEFHTLIVRCGWCGKQTGIKLIPGAGDDGDETTTICFECLFEHFDVVFPEHSEAANAD